MASLPNALPHTTVADAFHARGRLVAYLMRCYPGECRGRVEDAVGAAFLQALERPAAFEQAVSRGGTSELVSFMHLVARRQLRQDCRRKAYRTETPVLVLPDSAGADNPESMASARQLQQAVQRKLDEATQLYGGTKKERFRIALGDRLASGAPDTRVARSHGVPRESLCRARRWLMQEVQHAA